MINAEPAFGLELLGYTKQEARFIHLAADHGGYFLRRQYARFLEREDGGTISQLIERVLQKGHVKASTWSRKVQVYHLCARPLYQAIGQANSRNRRRRQPLTIKNKLMGLDFVLDHPCAHYLATEQEKVSYFVNTFHVPMASLPAKHYRGVLPGDITPRYFVDKYPIFRPSADVSTPAVVTFCFVDEGQTTTSHFETYLGQYGKLFSYLPQFCVIYIAASSAPFGRAQRLFERYLKVWTDLTSAERAVPDAERLLRHFADRRQFDSRDLGSFDRSKLLRFRDEREEFSGPKYEALYERWKAEGAGAVTHFLPSEKPRRTQISGAFSTYLLKHDYDIFGTESAA